MELILNWVAIVFLLCAIVHLWVSRWLEKGEIYNDLGRTVSAVNSRFDSLEKTIAKLKEENVELYTGVAILHSKLGLIIEANAFGDAEKKKKQEPKKRDQKEKAIKLINEALYKSPLSFSEIVALLDQEGVSLKKSTVGVYLSSDERFESKDGKWQLKKLDESPSVS